MMSAHQSPLDVLCSGITCDSCSLPYKLELHVFLGKNNTCWFFFFAWIVKKVIRVRQNKQNTPLVDFYFKKIKIKSLKTKLIVFSPLIDETALFNYNGVILRTSLLNLTVARFKLHSAGTCFVYFNEIFNNRKDEE